MFKQIWAISIFVFILGCSSIFQPSPTSRINPTIAGIDLDIRDLLESSDSFDVYYSGPKYNPSALLFIPSRSQSRLSTAMDWKEVHQKYQVEKLLNKINTRGVSQNDLELWSIVPSDTQEISRQDVLAYIYTSEYANINKQSPGNYTIQSIPEQFSPVYYDPKFDDPYFW